MLTAYNDYRFACRLVALRTTQSDLLVYRAPDGPRVIRLLAPSASFVRLRPHGPDDDPRSGIHVLAAGVRARALRRVLTSNGASAFVYSL